MRKTREKKAQSAIEFMILVGAVILFFISFLFVIQGNLTDKFREEYNVAIYDIASIVQDELNLARNSADGYLREFVLPERVISLEYSIIIVDDSVYINTIDNQYTVSLPVPVIAGGVQKGINVGRKDNGVIYFNVEPYCGDGFTRSVGEQCDDGKYCEDDSACTEDGDCSKIGDELCSPRNADGCSSTCALEICGNGIIGYSDPGGGYIIEICDDGNTNDGDGCSASCKRTSGWICENPGQPCRLTQCNNDCDDDGDGKCDYDGHTPCNDCLWLASSPQGAGEIIFLAPSWDVDCEDIDDDCEFMLCA